MEMIKTMVITGYRSFELGVFQDKDPKIAVIKKVIKNTIISYLDQGLEWVLVGGNLGTELWGAEAAIELREDYPELKVGVIFPFAGFGGNWKEPNQLKLQQVTSRADFVDSVSHQAYENPQQLRNHTRFLLDHSGGSIILYDEEFEGKPQFFLRDARSYSEEHEYLIHQITMDDLQNAISFD